MSDHQPLTLVKWAQLDAQASPGPWQRSRFVDNPRYQKWTVEMQEQARSSESCVVRGPGIVGTPACNVILHAGTPENAALVAASRNAPTRLLSALRALPRWTCGYSGGRFQEEPSVDGRWIKVGDLRTLIEQADLSKPQ